MPADLSINRHWPDDDFLSSGVGAQAFVLSLGSQSCPGRLR
jgi:hypothetical protein